MDCLNRVLARAGVASRRKCEQLVLDGRVCVNGEEVRNPTQQVSLDHDEIAVDGQVLMKEERKVYFLINKPPNYVCASTPSNDSPSVLELLGERKERLFSVGRLDTRATGLLLITNDGDFANQVKDPASNIEKEYLADTNCEITEEHLKHIAAGCMVEGTWVKPKSVKGFRRRMVRITLTDDRKREVRKLLKEAGLSIVKLTCERIGGVSLGKLPEGEFRQLTPKERDAILGKR